MAEVGGSQDVVITEVSKFRYITESPVEWLKNMLQISWDSASLG